MLQQFQFKLSEINVYIIPPRFRGGILTTNTIYMKNIKNIALMLLCVGGLQAQSLDREVVSNAGETISNGAVSLDFTVGELAVTDITNGAVTLNQGFHQTLSVSISIATKILLEGPSAGGGLMSDDLRGGSVIPLTSPYPDAKTTMAQAFVPTGNDAVVDWVYVSLMDKTDRSIEIASVSGFVQVDGDIVKANGVDPLDFDVAADDYYVRIIHRNHLAILTAAPITLDGSVSMLDLTADPLAIFGGASAVSDLGGVFAMVSGDAESNGQIQNADVNDVRPQIGLSGYSNRDTDMNGQVQTSDINLYIRPNLGRGIQF